MSPGRLGELSVLTRGHRCVSEGLGPTEVVEVRKNGERSEGWTDE